MGSTPREAVWLPRNVLTTHSLSLSEPRTPGQSLTSAPGQSQDGFLRSLHVPEAKQHSAGDRTRSPERPQDGPGGAGPGPGPRDTRPLSRHRSGQRQPPLPAPRPWPRGTQPESASPGRGFPAPQTHGPCTPKPSAQMLSTQGGLSFHTAPWRCSFGDVSGTCSLRILP